MAAQGPAASPASTSRQGYVLVSRRIASAIAPSTAYSRAQFTRQRQAVTGGVTGKSYAQAAAGRQYTVAAYARAVRAQQGVARRASLAQAATTATMRQSLQSGAASGARIRAVSRAVAFGSSAAAAQAGVSILQGWSTLAASGTMTLPGYIWVSARNTSAAARAAQAARARKGNPRRRGTTYRKKGAGVIRARGQAPRQRGRAPRRQPRNGPVVTILRPRAPMTIGREYPGDGHPRWITAGNDRGLGNCAAVAIANHLLWHERLGMTDEQVALLAAQGETVPALIRAMERGLFAGVRVREWHRGTIGWPLATADGIAVYWTGAGLHAGFCPADRRVVSYGREEDLHGTVEEAWFIRWEARRPRVAV